MATLGMLLVTVLLAGLCLGDTEITIQLDRYENPQRLLANGGKCNGSCKTYLEICIYKVNPSDGSCDLGSVKTVDLTNGVGRDIIDLSALSNINVQPSGSVRNPLSFIIRGPLEPYVVRIQAKEDIQTGTDPLQKVFILDGDHFPPGRYDSNVTYSSPTPLTFSNNPARLSLRVKTQCLPGFVGSNCGIPCNVPGGDFTRWQCNDTGVVSCRPQFTGSRCEIEMRVCQTSPCVNGATCRDVGPGQYQCDCPPGFAGDECQNRLEQQIDYCSTRPCRNGGLCSNRVGTYSCTCSTGYTGINCEQQIDYCSSRPCLNGGLCSNRVGTYHCTCSTGYTGINCEQEIDYCSSRPCLNGGLCSNRVGTYHCTCSTGYPGINCEQEIDYCSSRPCLNGGLCSNRVGTYHCTCPTGYTGINCEQEIGLRNPSNDCEVCDPSSIQVVFSSSEMRVCQTSPCVNGATCRDVGSGQYQCDCPPGFAGDECQNRLEQQIDYCSTRPCLNGGLCSNRVGTYHCTCSTGYTGINCEQQIDYCSSRPCLNGGLCSNRVGTYHCTCLTGYTGINCEQEIDYCSSRPCLNGGLCSNRVGTYHCTCSTGYPGINCEQEIDYCSSRPCLNGGLCSNRVGTYHCTCPTGYTGINCEQEIGLRNPSNDCEVCDPSSNQVVFSSSAGSSCMIDGQSYADGATDPKNRCQRCDVIKHSAAWSPVGALLRRSGTTITCSRFCNEVQLKTNDYVSLVCAIGNILTQKDFDSMCYLQDYGAPQPSMCSGYEVELEKMIRMCLHTSPAAAYADTTLCPQNG